MVKTEIKNLNPKRKIYKADISRAVKEVVEYFKIKNSIEVNLLFVSDQRIISINKKYLKENVATDVISFWVIKDMLSKVLEKNIKEPVFIGDIAVSTDRVFYNSKKFLTTYKKEMLLCVVHGILHLLGFKDYNKKQKTEMRRLEEKIIRNI